jgi:Ca-activated chloride channel family protein
LNSAMAQVTVPFTNDSDRFVETIAKTRSLGRTHLMDAVDLAVSELKKARNPRRIIVIFSDGGDNGGHRTEDDIHKALVESDVQVFAVGLFRLRFRERSPEEAEGPWVLDSLAR